MKISKAGQIGLFEANKMNFHSLEVFRILFKVISSHQSALVGPKKPKLAENLHKIKKI